jgi:hypothetical protein
LELNSLRQRLAEANAAAVSAGGTAAGGTGTGALVMVRKVRALEAQLLDAQRDLAAATAAAKASAAQRAGSMQTHALLLQLEEVRSAAAEEAKSHEAERSQQVRGTTPPQPCSPLNDTPACMHVFHDRHTSARSDHNHSPLYQACGEGAAYVEHWIGEAQQLLLCCACWI